MDNDRPYRHELKYLINRRDMDSCMSRLREFASYDDHIRDGKYMIRSLYYDDMYRSAYTEKENGTGKRSKYRIRIYNMDEGFICLEKKIKDGSYIRKESAVLDRHEYDMIIGGDTDHLLGRSESVANDFAAKWRMDMLRPEVIVDYDRVPLIYDHGNVRITFDMNVRAVVGTTDIFDDKAPSYEVLGPDQLIMEVKYTEFLPDIFRAILPDGGCRLAMSKYVMCCDIKSKFS